VALLEAAAQIAQNLGAAAGLSLVVPEVNSMGSVLLGGLPLEDALLGDFDALVIAENDLFTRLPKTVVQQVLSKTQNVIVLDHQHTDTAKRAGLVFSAASFAEADGTVVSMEGRAQRYFQVFDPSYLDPSIQIKEGWRWLHAIKTGMDDKAIEWTVLDDVIEAIVRQVPALEGIIDAAPNAGYRVNGLKIAREPRRYSGRTAMRAPLSVHEPKQPVDLDSGLTFSMEGYVGNQTDSALIPFAWAPGWNSPQSWNKFQDEVGGHLKGGDAGVRLFDRLPKRAARAYVAPAAEQVAVGQYRILPVFNLFSSGEMSSRIAVFKDRQAPAAFRLTEDDARSLNVKAGQMLSVTVGTENVVLPVQIVEYLPVGVIGYPVGQAPVVDFAQAISVQVTAAQAMGG
jgi:NADH-quinone oxidoreductase subunit G